MKKNHVLIILLVIFANNAWGKVCGCGSYEKGTYSYSVGDKQGCCTGTASGAATFTTWDRDNDGVWTVADTDYIDASKAQKSCCS